jgi:hypothetical protein
MGDFMKIFAVLMMLTLVLSACETGSSGEIIPDHYDVPGADLAEKLAWVKENEKKGWNYIIEVDQDETIEPTVLSLYSDTRVTLVGTGSERIINLASKGSLFEVRYGELILDKNITLRGREDNDRPLVYVGSGALRMKNGSWITGNTNNNPADGSYNDSRNNGGGVFLYDGKFNMEGGKISGNTVKGTGKVVPRGGGVYVGTYSTRTGGNSYVDYVNISKSDFVMWGGEISDNTAFQGGGVYVRGKFDMYKGTGSNGGIIKDNTATSDVFGGKTTTYTGKDITVYPSGGGVCSVSDCNLSTGKISGNEAFSESTSAYGGGVYMESSSTFYLWSNGEISNNTVTGNGDYSDAYGGGVCVSGENAKFVMSGGGKITGNTAVGNSGENFHALGGGVCVESKGTFIMGKGTYDTGDGEISGNTAESPNDENALGGGVCIWGGFFRLSNGIICGSNEVDTTKNNHAKSGAALYVRELLPNDTDFPAEYGTGNWIISTSIQSNSSTWKKTGNLATTADRVAVADGARAP